MKRGDVKRYLFWGLFMALLFSVPGGAQDLDAVEGMEDAPLQDGEMRERYVTPDLESMNLIWIQEGDVLRVGYVVQSGDTMWDIARKYLNSPYYWPKIWERNSAVVVNPHLIFPGDILYLYPAVVIEAPDEVTDHFTQIEEKKKRQIEYKSMGSTGFISLDELKAAGKIVDNLYHKKLLGEGDIVYVDVGKVGYRTAGDQYAIFRVFENSESGDLMKVMHPITGELIGYQIVNVGRLELTSVEAKVSEARISKSYIEVLNGDLIIHELQPLTEKIEVVETNLPELKGYIIASKNNVSLIGEGQIVYLDVGSEDGVVKGNRFVAYEACEIVPDGLSDEFIRIPHKVIGELVVLEARETTSTALVTESRQEIRVGDRVLMSKFNRWEIEGVSQPSQVESCRQDRKCMLISAEAHAGGVESPYCEILIESEVEKEKEQDKVREKYQMKE